MEPLTRKEFFMAKAAGQSVPDIEPITREEYFLNQIAENTGGGGLPEITEGDDGKVLTASDGEAVWASGGGGSSDPYPGYDAVFTVDYSVSESNPEIVKGSYADLVNKITNGEPITAAFLGYNSSGYNNISCFVHDFSYSDELNKIIISIFEFMSQSSFAIDLKSDNTVVWAE